MTHIAFSIRTIPVALAVATLAVALAIPRAADAQGNVQRCYPKNSGKNSHRKVVSLPGVTVYEQTCVIRFRSAGKVKAWVHTVWRRKNFRTHFRQYTVQTRLEFNDADVEKLRCRYAARINRSRRGSATCETTAKVAISQSRLYTGDGAVDFKANTGRGHRSLHGSPRV